MDKIDKIHKNHQENFCRGSEVLELTIPPSEHFSQNRRGGMFDFRLKILKGIFRTPKSKGGYG